MKDRRSPARCNLSSSRYVVTRYARTLITLYYDVYLFSSVSLDEILRML